jgi:hypothetical protein
MWFLPVRNGSLRHRQSRHERCRQHGLGAAVTPGLQFPAFTSVHSGLRPFTRMRFTEYLNRAGNASLRVFTRIGMNFVEISVRYEISLRKREVGGSNPSAGTRALNTEIPLHFLAPSPPVPGDIRRWAGHRSFFHAIRGVVSDHAVISRHSHAHSFAVSVERFHGQTSSHSRRCG